MNPNPATVPYAQFYKTLQELSDLRIKYDEVKSLYESITITQSDQIKILKQHLDAATVSFDQYQNLLTAFNVVVGLLNAQNLDAANAKLSEIQTPTDGPMIFSAKPHSLGYLMDCLIEDGHIESITDLTCYRCPLSKTCEFAWDPYNTNGDCLADK